LRLVLIHNTGSRDTGVILQLAHRLTVSRNNKIQFAPIFCGCRFIQIGRHEILE
jgi:hypothetical protein